MDWGVIELMKARDASLIVDATLSLKAWYPFAILSPAKFENPDASAAHAAAGPATGASGAPTPVMPRLAATTYPTPALVAALPPDFTIALSTGVPF
jgi:hypothetical protein